MDCSLPGSSVHGILQARILKWVTSPFSSRSSQPGDGLSISSILYIGRLVFFFTTSAKGILKKNKENVHFLYIYVRVEVYLLLC